MSEAKEFQLGQVYRDGVSGVVGLAVAVYTHISGTNEVKLQPSSKDGIELPKEVWTHMQFLQEVPVASTTEEVK